MTDIFKSALGYLGTNGLSTDNEYIGQCTEVAGLKLRIKKVIAEGW